MKVLGWGLFLYCFAFLLHLILWKIRLPRRQTTTFLSIFFATLVIGLVMAAIAKFYLHMNIPAPETIPEYSRIVLFVTSLTLAYMITYSAMEADSPSLVMVMTIAHAGPNGLERGKFDQLMTDDLLITPRIHDLLRDKLVYKDGERYKLSAKGIVFARIFIIYRYILNASRKGG